MDPKIFKTVLCENPSEEEYTYWKRMMTIYMSNAKVPEESKRDVLFVLCGQKAYSIIEDCTDFQSAVALLDSRFIKRSNAVMMRHKLYNHKQAEGQSIESFLSDLTALAKRCPTQPLTADQHKNMLICDAFISGLQSVPIRQRLLESSVDDLDQIVKTALTMELAIADAQNISSSNAPSMPALAATSKKRSCFWCGGAIHSKATCPARNSTCRNCEKKGHWATVCHSKKANKESIAAVTEENVSSDGGNSNCAALFQLAAVQGAKNLKPVRIQGCQTDALIDTGSDKSFISLEFCKKHGIAFKPCRSGKVLLADHSQMRTIGQLSTEIEWDNRFYVVCAPVVQSLIADVVLGLDLLSQHKSLTVEFSGKREPISVCLAMTQINSQTYSLAPGVDFTRIRPITTSSRPYQRDHAFIEKEVERLLKEGVIQESRSCWRSQAFVVNQDDRKRLVIDYSNTINRFTPLDAYPTPKIDEILNLVGQHSFFSKIDLKAAYHQVPLMPEEYYLTAFEALGKLYEFRRLPFGCTNAVPIFQRTMNNFIHKHSLADTYAYLDDIIICGRTQQQHDENLAKFRQAASLSGLQFSPHKCKFSQDSIDFLGHVIEHGSFRPDPARYKSLIDMPEPKDLKQLNNVIGLFAYYAKWIKSCSTYTTELIKNRVTFDKHGLSEEAKHAIKCLKKELVSACLAAPLLDIPFTIETDASDVALGGVLSQGGRPVAFYSRVLHNTEKFHSIIEKEACALVECCKRWRHLIKSAPSCQAVIDQRSVAFIFDKKHTSKIKNEKIMRWRLELSDLNLSINYRPGNENVVADALTRCTAIQSDLLANIHDRLCHPGITRLYHYCRSHNMPFSLEDIRKMTSNCQTCRELKPTFYKPAKTKLIQSTAPWERLSIDFVGPMANSSGYTYMLTIVDEFSRYPFAYPCKDMRAETVINKLVDLFSIFGCPRAIHSDRGTQFESELFRKFLLDNSIIKTRTTPYRPQANGQCERTNGSICKGIALTLRSKNLPKDKWTDALPIVLSSLRGLLCTATNCTPHERLFKYPRRSAFGDELPDFLLDRGSTVLHRVNIRSKGDPLTEKVKLLETLSPHFARILFPSGRTTTVSTSNLAPLNNFETDPLQAPPNTSVVEDTEANNIVVENSKNTNDFNIDSVPFPHTNDDSSTQIIKQETADPDTTIDFKLAQRSQPQRTRTKPVYLRDYQCDNPRGGGE